MDEPAPKRDAARKAEKVAAPPPPVVRPRYLAAVFGSALGALALFYAALFTLKATDNLPPPAFSNSICVDEKLAFHRQHPIGEPNLLVIGSSVAWRHFDGAVLVQDSPTTKPLNGAFCGLSVNQTRYVADWFLDRRPSIQDVLLITSPQDFENCTTTRTALFDAEDVEDYVLGHGTPWGYYLRYFDLLSLARNAREIAAKRSGENWVDPLVFDPYGGGPLDTRRNRETPLYGMVRNLDSACFDALGRLSARLQQEGRRLMVASTPLNPEWKASGDPEGQTVTEFTHRIRKTLAGNSLAEFWDGDAAQVVGPAGFFDAIHLRWSAAKTYTAALVKALHPGMTSTPRAMTATERNKL
ncbi:hypothetical protein QMO56_07005 [Roseomonas sp. E05]|uniref:hypothetical protein n=1 Tax=Roseomonas sp. E05 TaxID=3046310 RepID=UPI0024BBB4ED|nr:hypothetical protein [Roseomonas sp. E05]MDJ0387857.1 hypothetical protein [Roseomonas sp. E05]